MKTTKIILACLLVSLSVSQKSSAQELEWAVQIGANNTQIARSVAVDNEGNVYTCGDFGGTVDFDPGPNTHNIKANNADVFIQKLDANGNFMWATSISGSMEVHSFSLTLDELKNVYVTGYFNGTADMDPGSPVMNVSSNGNEDIFIQKLDSKGDFIWAKSIGGIGADYGHALTVDKDYNVFITGIFQGTVDFDPGTKTSNKISSNQSGNCYFLKLNSNGEYSWVETISASGHSQGVSLATDNDGNLYTTGGFRGSSANVGNGSSSVNLFNHGLNDIFITKHNSQGALLWAQSLGGSDVDRGYAIVVAPSNHIYIGGFFEGTVDFNDGAQIDELTGMGDEDGFILKLDLNGNYIWSKMIGGELGEDRVKKLSLDQFGNVLASGYFSETADFNPGVMEEIKTSKGGFDAYVLMLNKDGEFLWVETYGGIEDDVSRCATGHGGDLYIAGHFRENMDVDPSTTTYNLNCSSSVTYDGYVIKWKQPLLSIGEIKKKIEVSIYPNPNNGQFVVEFDHKLNDIKLQIHDASGRYVSSEIRFFESSAQIELNVPPGFYFLSISWKGGNKIEKIIVQ